jgi:hypothetical protein
VGKILDPLLGAIATINIDAGIGVGNGGSFGSFVGHRNQSVFYEVWGTRWAIV